MTSEVECRYPELIPAFVNGAIDGPEFEARFLELHRGAEIFPLKKRARVIDRLMLEVDAYCADPALRASGDIDEEALRQAAQQALRDW